MQFCTYFENFMDNLFLCKHKNNFGHFKQTVFIFIIALIINAIRMYKD
nr:MAG TPA: hypothetical protein [Caudoviricetes sp.]